MGERASKARTQYGPAGSNAYCSARWGESLPPVTLAVRSEKIVYENPPEQKNLQVSPEEGNRPSTMGGSAYEGEVFVAGGEAQCADYEKERG